MDLTRINKSELFVLALSPSQINNSLNSLDELHEIIENFKAVALEKVANISIMRESLRAEEIRRHSIFSEAASTSSEVKDTSEKVISGLMDNISLSNYLEGPSIIDFRKSNEETIFKHKDSPYFEAILDLTSFSKLISKNIRFFAKKTVTLKDVESSLKNDQSIFTVFLKGLAIDLSNLRDLSKKIDSYKLILQDSLFVISIIEDNDISKEEFYELADREKIEMIRG